jgi:hypothetical protein
VTGKYSNSKISLRTVLFILTGFVAMIVITTAILYFKTLGRVQIQFDIHLNKKPIYLSTYAEPPQFAIWIENPKNGDCSTVFVTHRVSKGDWEGKKNVPVALPLWVDLFKVKKQAKTSRAKKDHTFAVTGATPKDDYFSVRVEVPPGSEWICWIEMNLAGDYNEAFPELNAQTFEEDEYSCGQPALVYKAAIKAIDGSVAMPELVHQSVWENGENRIEPVSEGVTTARNVFDDMKISVLKPKIKIIEDAIEDL